MFVNRKITNRYKKYARKFAYVKNMLYFCHEFMIQPSPEGVRGGLTYFIRMKKVLFAAVALMAVCTFNSCVKDCNCTEANSGYSQKISTSTAAPTCKDIEKTFVDVGAQELGQNWTCK